MLTKERSKKALLTAFISLLSAYIPSVVKADEQVNKSIHLRLQIIQPQPQPQPLVATGSSGNDTSAQTSISRSEALKPLMGMATRDGEVILTRQILFTPQ